MGGVGVVSGNLWEPAPDTSRTQSLPDGCLGTRNAPLGQGSDQQQLLTAQGRHCKSVGGRETEAHLEEGKRGVRRRERHVGLARWGQGCRDANTGDQAGRTFPSLCKEAEHTRDPGRLGGARVADSSVGGGWVEEGREQLLPGKGKAFWVRMWHRLRAQTEIFNPPTPGGLEVQQGIMGDEGGKEN